MCSESYRVMGRDVEMQKTNNTVMQRKADCSRSTGLPCAGLLYLGCRNVGGNHPPPLKRSGSPRDEG